MKELNEEKKLKLFDEFQKLKKLSNENIYTIIDVWREENNFVFITDSFDGGSIRQYLY